MTHAQPILRYCRSRIYSASLRSNGNLTALPGISNVSYDVFDRVISLTKSGSTSTAKYEAFGRRIERVFSGTTRVYFYDLGGRLLAE